MAKRTIISVFVFAQIMDILSTNFAVDIFGQKEFNPVAGVLFQKVGMEETMLIKIFIAFLVVGFYILISNKFRRFHSPVEKSLKIGSLGTWIAVLLNIVGIISVV